MLQELPECPDCLGRAEPPRWNNVNPPYNGSRPRQAGRSGERGSFEQCVDPGPAVRTIPRQAVGIRNQGATYPVRQGARNRQGPSASGKVQLGPLGLPRDTSRSAAPGRVRPGPGFGRRLRRRGDLPRLPRRAGSYERPRRRSASRVTDWGARDGLDRGDRCAVRDRGLSASDRTRPTTGHTCRSQRAALQAADVGHLDGAGIGDANRARCTPCRKEQPRSLGDPGAARSSRLACPRAGVSRRCRAGSRDPWRCRRPRCRRTCCRACPRRGTRTPRCRWPGCRGGR